MRREDAIKKLGKLLGKSFRYQVDTKAPDADEREAARLGFKVASERYKRLGDQLTERRNALLAADPEYQQLKEEFSRASKQKDELGYTSRRYRFTAGTMGDLFFTVLAQGDSWEEVIAKLTKKEPCP